MSIRNLDQLAELIKKERDALLANWRDQVRQLPSARDLDPPAVNDHIPEFLDQLVSALQSKSHEAIPKALAEGSPPAHGLQRLREGFDLREVVAEYNILRNAIHDLVENNGLSLEGEPFHIINRLLDHAIGLAVQTYATHRALDLQRQREEYLAFAIHDLRTPLNAIAVTARVLELTYRQRSAQAETAQMLEILGRNVQHLQKLIEKIIEENTSLRTETGLKLERRRFELWPLVETLIHDLRPVAETGSTQLINDVPHNLVVYADASLLHRVFQNLIGNAIKYTLRGEVRVGARQLDKGEDIECWVSDNGAGIPKARLETVFDEPKTDSQKEGRSGLGLAIVKTFIEAHGGKITVESKVALGSTFRFTLPVRSESNSLTNGRS
jgi:two-component system phosphate regulon sensor histidine kinase PhoR